MSLRDDLNFEFESGDFINEYYIILVRRELIYELSNEKHKIGLIKCVW